MSMWIKGTIEEDICNHSKCKLCNCFGPDDYECTRWEEKGWDQLMTALDLWKLFDKEKFSEYNSLLDEFYDSEHEIKTISIPQIKRIITSIEELDIAMHKFAGKDLHITKEKADYIKKIDPTILTAWDTWEVDGKEMFTLGNRWIDITAAKQFLTRALELNKEIEFD
jgi:hypothetical protein